MTGFRKINDEDDIETFAKWIYLTDQFLFTKLFKDETDSVKAIVELINNDYLNEYHRNFITLIYEDNPDEVRGMIISFRTISISNESTYNALNSLSSMNHKSIVLNFAFGKFFASYRGDNDYYIGNLYVKENYRNQGFGSKLVEKSKQMARQLRCKNILLDVEYDKPYLIYFYGKLGFEQNSKNYFKLFGKTYGYQGLKHKIR